MGELAESVDVAALSEVEATILAIWRRVLGRQTITVNDSFDSVGGDSVSGMRVLAGIRQAGFSLAGDDYWDADTVAELARLVRREDGAPPVSVGRSVEPVALTPAQHQMFGSPRAARQRGNIIHRVCTPSEALDVDILRAAIDSVVAAHEALRMTFENDEGVVRPVLRNRFETPICGSSICRRTRRRRALSCSPRKSPEPTPASASSTDH